MDIHIIWALIVVFATLMYTIFDGFDLGVGILLSFIKDAGERDTMVDTITPVWDGNESWIVLAGVGLFGGFPLAYSTLLPALYIPVVLMVISLAMRGVAMEFRFLSLRHKLTWDAIFSGGSLLAAFCQGIILANVIDGIIPREPATAIDPLHFLSPFAISTGLIVILIYALIGANWLNMKTGAALQAKFVRFGLFLIPLLSLVLAIVFYGRTHFAFLQPRFVYQGSATGLHIPLAAWYAAFLIAMCGLFICLRRRNDVWPFIINILIIVFLGLFIISQLWPFIVPPYLSIEQAGAPRYGNTILLIGALVVIPVILCYLIYSYAVFKGKTTGDEHYEPVVKDDLEDLRYNGIATVPSSMKPVLLSWPIRILLSLLWLILFFIVLGFLGDGAAIGIIVLLNLSFLFFWYKRAAKTDSRDKR